MKLLKISVIALFIVSSFAACKKDKITVVTIDGNWTGKLSTSVDTEPNLDFIATIKTDGTLTITYNSNNHDGTYVVTGSTFKADVPTLGINFSATFDKNNGKLINGTTGIHSQNQYSGYGKFYLNKDK